jgi:hypothetical protein
MKDRLRPRTRKTPLSFFTERFRFFTADFGFFTARRGFRARTSFEAQR